MKIHTSADAARAIKMRRLALGLTQQESAEAVGVTRQSLARIEKGAGGSSLDTYLRLFELLGLSLESTTRSIETSSGADQGSQLSDRLGTILSQNLTATPSFEEHRRTIASLQHSLVGDKIDLSGQAIGLAHLKAVIDSSAPELEAEQTGTTESIQPPNEGLAQ